MVKSDKLGVTKVLIDNVASVQLRDFIQHKIDNFHSTHTPENEIVNEIFLALKESGDIYESDVEQFYDPIKEFSSRSICGWKLS